MTSSPALVPAKKIHGEFRWFANHTDGPMDPASGDARTSSEIWQTIVAAAESLERYQFGHLQRQEQAFLHAVKAMQSLDALKDTPGDLPGQAALDLMNRDVRTTASDLIAWSRKAFDKADYPHLRDAQLATVGQFQAYWRREMLKHLNQFITMAGKEQLMCAGLMHVLHKPFANAVHQIAQDIGSRSHVATALDPLISVIGALKALNDNPGCTGLFANLAVALRKDRASISLPEIDGILKQIPQQYVPNLKLLSQNMAGISEKFRHMDEHSMLTFAPDTEDAVAALNNRFRELVETPHSIGAELAAVRGRP